MPYIRDTNDNQSERISCGGDFNKASQVLRDILKIVTSAEETLKVWKY